MLIFKSKGGGGLKKSNIGGSEKINYGGRVFLVFSVYSSM